MTFNEALGAEIKAARVRARLRQVDLAEKVDVGQPAISNYESGKASPSVATLVEIGRATGQDPVFLLRSANAYAMSQQDAVTDEVA